MRTIVLRTPASSAASLSHRTRTHSQPLSPTSTSATKLRYIILKVTPVPDVARLLTALHTAGLPDRSYPPLKRRVAYLFESWARHRTRQPELVEVVSPDLFERGQQLASSLAGRTSPAALLHGDLTPVSVL